MAYELPNGRVIGTPRKGRFFLLPSTGDTKHPERNLVAWEIQGVLGDYGITKVADPAPDHTPRTLNQQKKTARRAVKLAAIAFMHGNFDAFDRTLIAQVYANNSDKRPMIKEVYDWEQGIIDDLFDTIDGINAAADEAALVAVVWDFEVWSASKPPHSLKQMLRT